VEVGGAQILGVGSQLQAFALKARGIDLARPVMAFRQLGDPPLVDVEGNHSLTRSRKRCGDRQADVAETDHADAYLLIANFIQQIQFLVTQRAGMG